MSLQNQTPRRFRRSAFGFAEWLLLVVGAACLGWVGMSVVEASRFQEAQSAAAVEMLRARATAESGETPVVATALEPGSLLGMLMIPRLGLETPVLVGDNSATLDLAVGYLADTPVPWVGGNTALAGHRDGIFRPLKDIREGDDISLSTAHGDLRYRVRTLTIVDPEDVWVLEPQDRDVLTLITCYPFFYVGPAPQRFIVHAERVD